MEAENCSLFANESFVCDSGECIKEPEFCDGRSQCDDESDELSDICTASKKLISFHVDYYTHYSQSNNPMNSRQENQG